MTENQELTTKKEPKVIKKPKIIEQYESFTSNYDSNILEIFRPEFECSKEFVIGLLYKIFKLLFMVFIVLAIIFHYKLYSYYNINFQDKNKENALIFSITPNKVKGFFDYNIAISFAILGIIVLLAFWNGRFGVDNDSKETITAEHILHFIIFIFELINLSLAFSIAAGTSASKLKNDNYITDKFSPFGKYIDTVYELKIDLEAGLTYQEIRNIYGKTIQNLDLDDFKDFFRDLDCTDKSSCEKMLTKKLHHYSLIIGSMHVIALIATVIMEICLCFVDSSFEIKEFLFEKNFTSLQAGHFAVQVLYILLITLYFDPIADYKVNLKNNAHFGSGFYAWYYTFIAFICLDAIITIISAIIPYIENKKFTVVMAIIIAALAAFKIITLGFEGKNLAVSLKSSTDYQFISPFGDYKDDVYSLLSLNYTYNDTEFKDILKDINPDKFQIFLNNYEKRNGSLKAPPESITNYSICIMCFTILLFLLDVGIVLYLFFPDKVTSILEKIYDKIYDKITSCKK